jgi:hypothetical protein
MKGSRRFRPPVLTGRISESSVTNHQSLAREDARALSPLVLSSEWSTNQPMSFLSAYHFTALQWALAIFAAFGLGMSKTGFLGIALLDVALMAEIWPPRESTGVILPMLVFADFFAIFFFRVTLCGPKSGGFFPQPCLGLP